MTLSYGTWEYTGDPTTSTKDQVRFLIQDVDESDKQMSDEEINWMLSVESNVYLAASLACKTLAARYRAKAQSKSVGGLSISYGDRARQFEEQAKLLETTAQETSDVPVPVSTAMSKADKETRADDDDLNLAVFTSDEFENKGTGAFGG